MREWYGVNSASPGFKPEITLYLKLTTGIIFPKVSGNVSSYLWFTAISYQSTIRMTQHELDKSGFKPEIAFCLRFTAGTMSL